MGRGDGQRNFRCGGRRPEASSCGAPMDIKVDILAFLQVVTPVLVAIVGFAVKMILQEIREQKEALKDYVRQEECRLHRERLEHEMRALKGGRQ